MIMISRSLERIVEVPQSGERIRDAKGFGYSEETITRAIICGLYCDKRIFKNPMTDITVPMQIDYLRKNGLEKYVEMYAW